MQNKKYSAQKGNFIMCWGNGNGCIWLIIIVILLCGFGGWGSCGCNNNCGNDCGGCGCGC